jgi:predicted ATP-dependent endonuclease of OLD family
MQLIKFRIKNYKSVVDSGDCYVSPEITILAGKNESGKTSILEALRDFGQLGPIPLEAVPIDKESAEPEIAVTFAMKRDEVEAIISGLDLSIPET